MHTATGAYQAPGRRHLSHVSGREAHLSLRGLMVSCRPDALMSVLSAQKLVLVLPARNSVESLATLVVFAKATRVCSTALQKCAEIQHTSIFSEHHAPTCFCRLTIASSTRARVLNSAAFDARPPTCCRGPQSAPGHLRSGYAPIYVWPIDAAIPNVL